MRPFSLVAIACAVGCSSAPSLPKGLPGPLRARASRKPIEDVPRKVLAFYYPWYGTPAFDHGWSHWGSVDAGRRAIAESTHYPLAGAYDSHDPAAVERHVRELRRASVDGIVVSWWGPGDYTDAAMPLLLEKARAGGLDVAIYLERIRTPGDPSSALADLRYLVGTYGAHPAFLRVQGKPVIFIYVRAMGGLEPLQWAEVLTALEKEGGGIVAIADGYADMDAFIFDGLHTYNPVGLFRGRPLPEIRAVCVGLYRDIVGRARARGRIAAATVIPGYDDTKIRTPGIAVDRTGGELYRLQWEEAARAGADWALITSYNEWHEGSEIEPSAEFGDFFLGLTARFAETFRKAPRAATAAPPGQRAKVRPEEIEALRGALGARRIGIIGGFNALAIDLVEMGFAIDSLSWADLVERALSPATHPILLHVGGESYVRTIAKEGDVERAIQSYLGAGGALIAIPEKPFPFFYDASGKPVARAGAFGLPICGSPLPGETAREIPEAMQGFERPPAGERLVFRREGGAWPLLPAEIPYPDGGETRWRPLVPPPAGGSATYRPIYRLVSKSGKAYGDAAGLLEFGSGPLAGGRVLYVALVLWPELPRRDLLCASIAGVLPESDGYRALAFPHGDR
ncbi:MAG: hypothetical protein JXP34_23790 [Planctomycetes bacterium]|nr:hypothetical protein [Planctomycetota bacterium]